MVSKTPLAQSRAAGSRRDVKEAALKNLTLRINALFYLLTLSSFLTWSWERTSARCFRKKKKKHRRRLIGPGIAFSRRIRLNFNLKSLWSNWVWIPLSAGSTPVFFVFLSCSSRSQIRNSETQAASRKFQIHIAHKRRVRSLHPNVSNAFFTPYLFCIKWC